MLLTINMRSSLSPNAFPTCVKAKKSLFPHLCNLHLSGLHRFDRKIFSTMSVPFRSRTALVEQLPDSAQTLLERAKHLENEVASIRQAKQAVATAQASTDPSHQTYVSLQHTSQQLTRELQIAEQTQSNYLKSNGIPTRNSERAAAFSRKDISSALQALSTLAAATSDFTKAVASVAGGPAAFAAALPLVTPPPTGADRGDQTEPITTTSALATTEASAMLRALDATDPLEDISESPVVEFFGNKSHSEINAFNNVSNNGPQGKIYCALQAKLGVAGAVVGSVRSDQTISLWANNSCLRWRVVTTSFARNEDADVVKKAMDAATEMWNKISPGNVKFAHADVPGTESFLVTYGPPAGKRDVLGFFPSNYVKGYSRIVVHNEALAEGSRGNLTNAILHQLGHVLGFRHDFILESERRKRAGNNTKGSNPLSVMSLKRPSSISANDIVDTRMIYQKFSGGGYYELSDGRGNMIKFNIKRITP